MPTAIEIETTHEDGDAWIRAGFTETARVLEAPISALESHVEARKEPSFGSIHVQTDDVDAVVRAVRQFVPRLPGGSQGSVVLAPREGWTSAYDELTDREPEMLRRLARELSDRMGAFVIVIGVEEGRVVRYTALERGRVVDEYLSVPEYYGPLPPGRGHRTRRKPAADGAPHGSRRRRRQGHRAHGDHARGASGGLGADRRARPAVRHPARESRLSGRRGRAGRDAPSPARSLPRSRPCGCPSRREGRRP